MATQFKIEIEGGKAVIDHLFDYDQTVADIMQEEVVAAGADIANEAISNVRVKTGRLKQSIQQTTSLAGRETITEVEARTNYAAYVEFGTGGLVDVPAGLEEYAMQYKGQGIKQVNLPPRPYLFPAFFKVANELPDRINKQIKSGT